MFSEKSIITFLSVQESHGVQDDQLPSLQSIGVGLFTALALLTHIIIIIILVPFVNPIVHEI